MGSAQRHRRATMRSAAGVALLAGFALGACVAQTGARQPTGGTTSPAEHREAATAAAAAAAAATAAATRATDAVQANRGKLLTAWVEFAQDGVSVRAVVEGAACPSVKVDLQRRPMQVRQAASAAFPVTVCVFPPPQRARRVEIEGRTLSLRPHRVKRIVVIGDTGCRLKGADVQACNDVKKWPFATIAHDAVARHPDVVIHVGDYYYRETPCPQGDAGCAGSPHGDAWSSWASDFFEPSAPLLAAAPWVFARGNHEQCGRGSDGWFRFLDAGEAPMQCPATSAPFRVKLPGLSLDVIDTADMRDVQLGPEKVKFYQAQIDSIAKQTPNSTASGGTTWVVTHRPIWGFELTKAGEKLISQNGLLAKVVSKLDQPANTQLPGIDMLVTGHIHFFATLSFAGGLRPVQLIAGDGGDLLDDADTRGGQEKVDGLMTQYIVADTYGYLLLEKKGHMWNGTVYGVDDAVLARCTLRGRVAKCAPQPK